MASDQDSLLIFKMRGMSSEGLKKPAPEVVAPEPEAAPALLDLKR